MTVMRVLSSEGCGHKRFGLGSAEKGREEVDVARINFTP